MQLWYTSDSFEFPGSITAEIVPILFAPVKRQCMMYVDALSSEVALFPFPPAA